MESGTQFISQYPLWMLIICLLAGVLYAFLLYFKDKKLAETKKLLVYSMMGLRFLAITIITFLLIGPLIVNTKQIIEKPIIIVAQDNSESILINKDSTYYFSEYKENFNKIISQLEKQFQVVKISFGNEIKGDIDFSFKDKKTDFSPLFEDITTRFFNRNIGALILASDGIYNTATNPFYLLQDITFPVYCIGLGDTTIQKDIIISEINTNKIAFLGNRFPLQVRVKANKYPGKNVTVSVYDGGTRIDSSNIKFVSENEIKVVDFKIKAEKSGFRKYTIHVSSFNDEISKENNHGAFIIEVIENKQKVLLLAQAHHPDIAALSRSFEENENIESEFFTISEFKGKVSEHNLLVLHQLPSSKQSASTIITEAFANQIPILFILGPQTITEQINQINAGLKINSRRAVSEESSPIFNKQFRNFEINEDLINELKGFPPLTGPYGDFSISSEASVVLFQKIKGIATNKPLMLFAENNETKTGFICGEGIWRWRIYDYLNNGNHKLFDEFVNKTAQFLALKIKKERFIVNGKNVFSEHEQIVFSAELYNDAFELINEPDVNMDIKDNEGKKYPFTFSRSINSYRLNAGFFPAGDYSYKAQTLGMNKNLYFTGSFSVLPVNLEALQTVADHSLLYKISEKTKGRLFFPGNMNEIPETIKTDKNIVSISYSDKSSNDLISLKWLFYVILILLTIEWLFRKYFGSY